MKNNFKKNKGNLSQNSKSKKFLSDYTFYIGSVKQVLDYDTIMQFIINHMKKTYLHRNNIAEDIRSSMTPNFNKQKLQLVASMKPIKAKRKAEDQKFKLEFKNSV